MKKISLVLTMVLVANLIAFAVPAFADSGCPSKWAPGRVWPEGTKHSDGIHVCRGSKWVVESSTTTVTWQDFSPTPVVNDTAKAEIYVVQSGDTLYSIARRHGVTADAIKQANGLTGNTIWAGQRLTLPLVVAAVGATAIDGPLPFGDLVAIGLLAAGAAALLSSQQIQVPDHIANHPRGDVTSSLKTDAWKVAMAAWFGGQPPDWCGERHDGVKLVVYYSLGILRSTGKGIHRGLALILNGQSGSSTSIWDIRANSDGSPRGNGMDGFTKIPCPPPFSPAY